MNLALIVIFTFLFGAIFGCLIAPRIIISIIMKSIRKSSDKTINILRNSFKENGLDLEVESNANSTFITLKKIG